MTCDDETYFGLWSPAQKAMLGELLSSLAVDFNFIEVKETENNLREWFAWDGSSARMCVGFELFVSSADLEKVGTRIVEMFPERRYGAPRTDA
jgi:hypothetical protein